MSDEYVSWPVWDLPRYGWDWLSALEPVWGELWISPYSVYDRLYQWFSDTKYTLDLAFYRISDKKMTDLFCRLVHKGVRVRILHESAPYEVLIAQRNEPSFANLVRALSVCGDDIVRSDTHLPVMFSHQKAAVRDRWSVVIATANLTYPSLFSNREHWIVSDDPLIAQSLWYILEADWVWDLIDASYVHPNLVVCPLWCKDQLVDFILSAEEELLIATQYIQDSDVVEALRYQSNRLWTGMSLLVWRYQADGWLDDILAHVRVFSSSYLHTKAVLVDNTRLLVGSMNFSTNALENNRELSIIVRDGLARSRFRHQFFLDWEQSEQYK